MNNKLFLIILLILSLLVISGCTTDDNYKTEKCQRFCIENNMIYHSWGGFLKDKSINCHCFKMLNMTERD